MSTTLSLVSELERIARALETEDAGPAQPSLPAIAGKLARVIGVRDEEVASWLSPSAGNICIFWCRRH